MSHSGQETGRRDSEVSGFLKREWLGQLAVSAGSVPSVPFFFLREFWLLQVVDSASLSGSLVQLISPLPSGHQVPQALAATIGVVKVAEMQVDAAGVVQVVAAEGRATAAVGKLAVAAAPFGTFPKTC